MKRLEKWLGNAEAFFYKHEHIFVGCGYLLFVVLAALVFFGVFLGAA